MYNTHTNQESLQIKTKILPIAEQVQSTVANSTLLNVNGNIPMIELNFILDDPHQIAVRVVCFVKHHGDLWSRMQVDGSIGLL